jgi:DNA polymerase IIIc chi subunit
MCLMACSPENADVTTEIETLLIENLRSTEAEDINAVLATMHSEAPNYSQTQKIVNFAFETYDLKYELLLFRYIGQDDEYATARFKFSTQKVAGPDFKNNSLDTIHVFRKENDKWKIWSQATLEINYTD